MHLVTFISLTHHTQWFEKNSDDEHASWKEGQGVTNSEVYKGH